MKIDRIYIEQGWSRRNVPRLELYSRHHLHKEYGRTDCDWNKKNVSSGDDALLPFEQPARDLPIILQPIGTAGQFRPHFLHQVRHVNIGRWSFLMQSLSCEWFR